MFRRATNIIQSPVVGAGGDFLQNDDRVLKHPCGRGRWNVDLFATHEVQAERHERHLFDFGPDVFAGHRASPMSTNRFVMFPYASIRRSRRNGQCVRLNSTFSRSQGTTMTSSLSTAARVTTWPLGLATKDWPQNWMPSSFTGLPSGPRTFSRPMRLGAQT